MGFIEVTDIDGKRKILIPVLRITSIVQMSGFTFIEMGFDSKGVSVGIEVNEDYFEVKDLISKELNQKIKT